MGYVTYADGSRVLEGTPAENAVRQRLGLPPKTVAAPPAARSFDVVTGGQAAFGLGDIVKGGLSVLKRAIPGPIDDIAIDAIQRKLAKRPDPGPAPTGTSVGTVRRFDPMGTGPCNFPAIRVGNTCVDPSALPPGGRPASYPVATIPTVEGGAVGKSVYGLFVEPDAELVQVNRCPKGTVLGRDDRCYDKKTLPNKLRKYPKPPRLPITRSDQNAIRVAAAAERRVKTMAKSVGLKIK